jgi:hypothetical protein
MVQPTASSTAICPLTAVGGPASLTSHLLAVPQGTLQVSQPIITICHLLTQIAAITMLFNTWKAAELTALAGDWNTF